MKYEQNGFTFSDEDLGAKVCNRYAKSQRAPVKVFEVTKGDSTIYVMFNDKGVPIFESQSAEAIGVRIDLMKLAGG